MLSPNLITSLDLARQRRDHLLAEAERDRLAQQARLAHHSPVAHAEGLAALHRLASVWQLLSHAFGRGASATPRVAR